MSKAYDRLEWSFLEKCLLAFGFCESQVQQVLFYVKGISYKFKVNGIPSQWLIPQRGLRQGEPLSLYLFILAMESLSYMFLEAESSEKLTRLKVSLRTPTVTHLFFVDDIILFGKTRSEEAYEIVRILNLFSRASGQRVNTQKSGLIFGKKVTRDKKESNSSILSMQEWNSPGKYLGLPTQ